MNGFSFINASMTLYFETGVDAFGEPIIESATYRNVLPNASAAQLHAVATALVGLTNHTYIETVKTTRDLVAV